MNLPTNTPDKPQHADAASTAIPTGGHAKHWASAGERKFDRLTYRDIGYGVNVLSSIGAVWWAERTTHGQKALEGLGKLFAKIPSLTPERAKFFANKSFFLTGGFLVLLPMKWLEDAKSDLVKKWNRDIYGSAVDTDPELIRSQREVDTAPKQSWLSIFGSRILALIPFYATVGLLWDRTSLLAKWTNPELRAMSGDAIKTLEKTDPATFSQITSKGWYFDRPIATVSRFIGKLMGHATGNNLAIEEIETMQKTFPGTIQGSIASTPRDPIHSAMPYYIISEAITSALVARGVYLLTRVLGPIVGYKPREKNEPYNDTLPTISVTPTERDAKTAADRKPDAALPSPVLEASAREHTPLQAREQHAAISA